MRNVLRGGSQLQENGAPEILHNGIQLTKPWCLHNSSEASRKSITACYLVKSHKVITIDQGRQLCVDKCLIANSNVNRSFHLPRLHPVNPILKPETTPEMTGVLRPVACLINDVVCYDPMDRLFKMWYRAGWFDGMAYATSQNGMLREDLT